MFPRGMQPQARVIDESIMVIRSSEFILLVNDVAGLEASDTIQSML
jgi:hypothetical protein